MRVLSSAHILFLALGLLVGPQVSYAASGITYQGRILKPDGSPLEGNNIQFRLQIRTPGSQNCLMFEETHALDMRNSKGVFSLTLNDGTGARTDSSGFGLDRVFANRGTFNFAATSCATGNSYAPNADDGRKLVVEFKDETMSWWEPMPPTNINFVPFAFESKQVQGFGINSLVRVQEADGTMGNISPLSNANYLDLLNLIGGTSPNYVRASNGAGARVPVVTGNPLSPVAGSVWFDSVSGKLKFHDGSSAVDVGGGAGGGVTEVTAGSGLVSSPGAGITATGSIAIAVGGVVTNMLANGAVTSAKILDGTIVGSDLASNITIGTTSTITASGFSTTGNVTVGGDVVVAGGVSTTTVTSGTNITRQLQLFDPDTSSVNKITFTADTALNADYTLKWPLNAGSANQVLSTDGFGNLSWVNQASGADNLGNHTATQNIRLGSHWLSGDGGNEGLRVDANGNVGIGTATPSVPLEVAGIIKVGGTGLEACPSTGAGTIRFNPVTTSLEFCDGSGWTSAGAGGPGSQWTTVASGIYYGGPQVDIASGLVIGSYAAGYPAPSNGLIVSGSVGIGTTSPQTLLDVAGAIRVGDSATCGAPTAGSIRYNGGNLQLCNGTSWQTLSAGGSDSFAALPCGDGFIPYKASGAWGCRSVSTINTNDTIVTRDGSGSFAANSATLNSINLHNAGAFISLQGPMGATYSLTLPSNDGDPNQVLQTNGSGLLSWVNQSSGGGDFKADGSVAMSGNLKLGANSISNDGGVDEGLSFDTSGNATIKATHLKLEDDNMGLYAGIFQVAPYDHFYGSTYTPANPVSDGTGMWTNEGSGAIRFYTYGVHMATIGSGGNLSLLTGNYLGQSGSSGNPSYSFAADPNTGLYSPLADTLSLATGGAERLRVTSNGNVGIGTANPTPLIPMQTVLQIDGPAAVGSEFRLSSGSTTFTALNEGSSGRVALGTDSATPLVFYTGGSYLTNERLRITSAGNVGIGTTTPQRLLHVNGPMRLTASTPPPAPAIGDIIVDSNDSRLKWYDGATWQAAGGSGSGDFKADGTVNMSGQFKAINGTVASPGISFVNDTNTGFYKNVNDDDAIQLTLGGLDAASFSNYGIDFYRFISASNGTVAEPDFSLKGNSSTGTGLYTPATNTIGFATNSTEKMRIAANGNVGIGTTSFGAGERLNVAGGAIVAGPQGTLPNSGGEIRLKELALGGSNFVGFRAPDGLTGDFVWQLPSTLGNNGDVLTMNTGGILSWAPASGGGGGATNLDGLTDVATNYSKNVMKIGDNAASGSTGDNVTVIGRGAGANLSTGTEVTLIGVDAGAYSGNNSLFTAVGHHAAYFPKAGASGITAVGAFAAFNNNSGIGEYTTAVGESALTQNDGSNNTALGWRALADSSGHYNIAVGVNALDGNIGDSNIAIGTLTATNTSGSLNVLVGQNLFFNNGDGQTASRNVMVGSRSANHNESRTANNNVAVGFDALFNIGSGSNNVAIGSGAGSDLTSGVNNILIGVNAQAPTATTGNHLNIGGAIYGNLSTGSVGVGVASPSERLEVSGNVKATAFISTSDRRLKRNFTPVDGLAAIEKLNGVKWNWISDQSEDMGVIAQEVEEIFPWAVVTDKKTGLKAVKYQSLIAPLIEATKQTAHMCRGNENKVRELASRVEKLENQNRNLSKENDELRARLERIEKMLKVSP